MSKLLVQEDVTREYLDTAWPEQGAITYETGYTTKNHQGEINMAQWLQQTFGGEITLLKESKEPGSKTPDFLWKGRYWELKGISTKNSVDRAVREAAKQIQSYPGGIILDASASDLTVEAIETAVAQRVRRIALDSLDVLIISEEKLRKIVRYKK